MNQEQIKEIYLKSLADAFMKPESTFADNMNLRFREDLAANSMLYFPMLGDLEEALDIEIGLSDFQNNCHTVQQGLDYITSIVKKKEEKNHE